MTRALALSAVLGLLGPPPDAGGDGDDEADAATTDSAGEASKDAPAGARSRAYDEVLVPLPEAERDEAAAKSLMSSAKIAFKDERYEEAIELLAEAYRTYPYVTLLYSLGSAHRRAYEMSGASEHQTLSIRRYQQYLSSAPDAEYSALAQNYLTALLAERDLGDVELEVVTRVLVSTTAEEAVMIIDDGAPLPAPGAVSIEPGLHHIVVSAPGYFVVERDVNVPEGATYPIQAELEGIPGRVSVEGPKAATVRVDGRVVGRLPLDGALTVAPGDHSVVVTQNGHDPFSKDISLERDGEVELRAQLDISKRRFASFFLLGLGATGLATSVVLGSLAYERQVRALGINQTRLDGQLSEGEYDNYLAIVGERDVLRGGAVISGIAGLALLGGGLGLFIRDEPKIEASGGLARLRVAPYVGFDGAGVHAQLRF